MMSYLLEIRDLFCGYKRKTVLKGINLKVKEGEIVGIIGPNGSGKTTLFRAITKIIGIQSGKIFFEGKDIERISEKELARKIAVVTQDPEMDFSIPVFDFVLLGRIPHRKPYQFFEDKEDLHLAEEALRLTDLISFKDKPISNLSGGERQLASIAKALAQKPKLLLLDEPTSHLDIHHQMKILNLLKRLNRNESLTEIVILHDLNMASEFCDRLVLFSEGRIYREGTPEKVLTFDAIEDVYKTMVIIKENPLSLKPYVFPVFEEWGKRCKK